MHAHAHAQAAYHRAIALTLRNGDGSGSSGSDDQDDASLPQLLARSVFVGVACTAAVASGQPKKGAHRAHICTFARGDDGRYVGGCVGWWWSMSWYGEMDGSHAQ